MTTRKHTHPALTALRHQLREYVRAKLDYERLRGERSGESIAAELRYMRAKQNVDRAYMQCTREKVHVPTETSRSVKRATRARDGGWWVPVGNETAWDPEADGGRGRWI